MNEVNIPILISLVDDGGNKYHAGVVTAIVDDKLILSTPAPYLREARYVRIMTFINTSLPKEFDRHYSLKDDLVTLAPITEDERSFLAEV